MISKVEVERFSLSSSRPFDLVLAAINDAIGHPDMAEFWKSIIGLVQSPNWKARSKKC
jgi:hypothetical protein